ncbi:MAG: DUF4132 domain-containing protein [Pseudomonadales bacterium]|nr:DUF4132 domain-containing protein [Pseudomonadales bacterium]
MLSKIFSSNNTESIFHNIFQYLNIVDNEYSNKIVDYLINGNNPDVIKDIQNISNQQIEESGLKLKHYYRSDSKISEEHTIETKKNLKYIFESEYMNNPDIMFRLGMVFDAIKKQRHWNNYFSKNIPQWVNGLIHVIDQYHSSNSTKEKKWPENYSGDWFYELLEKNQIPMHDILSPLLERSNTYTGQAHVFKYLITTLDWSKILEDNKFHQYLNGLHYSAKITFLSIMNNVCDINKFYSLFIFLLSDKSKQVRKQAGSLLSKVDMDEFIKYSLSEFNKFNANQRKELALLLLVHGNESTAKELTILASNEKSKSVKDAIESSLLNRSAADSDTNELVMPPIPDTLKELPLPKSFKSNLDNALKHSLENAKNQANNEIIRNKENGKNYKSSQDNYNKIKKISKVNISDYVKYVEGDDITPCKKLSDIVVKSHIIDFNKIGIQNLIRILNDSYYYGGVSLRNRILINWLHLNPEIISDVRQFIPIIEKVGLSKRRIASWYFSDYWYIDSQLPYSDTLCFWPFFAENQEFLDEALSLDQSSGNLQTFDPGWAMSILSHFPVIPEKYLQVLYMYALSSSKTYAPYARELLENYGFSVNRVIEALKSSKLDERIVAAQWLLKVGYKPSIPDLIIALKKEQKETAKSILLNTLYDFGEPIDEYLSSKALLKEAEGGLKKAIPKALEWFNFNTLPILKWNNGKKVNPKILRWWIVLAFKLKEPGGNPLLNLYIKQLNDDCQKKIGLAILQIFIEYDTKCPTDEVAQKHAEQRKQYEYDFYQRWAKEEWGQQYKDKTIQDAYNELFKRKKREYLGSAISAKGILCLASKAQPADAVQLISRFMKDHHTKRHQIEAMLMAVAQNDDPIIIQLLLSIARRHRTRSVQEKAKELVFQISSRNNWTQDELADRTIPTAGFELNGFQELEMGSRNITIQLTDDLKPQILNEDGKILKSLPTARQNDDAEKVKESKKYYSTIKKELKQVSELQISRLYESFCIARVWPFNEWEEFLLNHPVMTHLTQKLIWIVNQNGEDLVFRPTAERELIDAQDDEVLIHSGASIRIANATAIGNDQVNLWGKLLKEEKIKQPFDQFKLPNHSINKEEEIKTELNYHEGWVTDTYSIRNVLTKLGYKRGDIGDGGFFSQYYKDYPSLKIRAVIEFSGNCLPEELLPAVLYKIVFVELNQRGCILEDSYKKIEDIPRNLVLETMKDYEQVASKGSFDEKWQSKSPW